MSTEDCLIMVPFKNLSALLYSDTEHFYTSRIAVTFSALQLTIQKQVTELNQSLGYLPETQADVQAVNPGVGGWRQQGSGGEESRAASGSKITEKRRERASAPGTNPEGGARAVDFIQAETGTFKATSNENDRLSLPQERCYALKITITEVNRNSSELCTRSTKK